MQKKCFCSPKQKCVCSEPTMTNEEFWKWYNEVRQERLDWSFGKK